ncbi:MAG: ribosome-associated translation inhibitor RaiA [Dorea sp.]|nr:ribosome-associated translation inhibitor RaiA [Dorea sp.]
MKVIIIGKNIEVTSPLREAVESKIGKLNRYFSDDTEIHVTLSVQHDRQKIEVTVPMGSSIIRAEEESSDMYVSIDLVEEILERQLRKYRKRLIDKHQEGGYLAESFVEAEEEATTPEIKIVRTKRFGIKPMFPEDACLEMELLGHDFFVFCNAETDEVNVVYKRKKGSYGLIEPSFDE